MSAILYRFDDYRPHPQPRAPRGINWPAIFAWLVAPLVLWTLIVLASCAIV